MFVSLGLIADATVQRDREPHRENDFLFTSPHYGEVERTQ